MSDTTTPPDRQDAPRDPHTPGRVETPIRCITCGYNLLGLDEAAVCPECATPVQDSTEGTLLGHSAPEYIHTLHHGALYVLLAVVIGVFLALGSVLVIAAITASGASAPWMVSAAEVLQQLGAIALNLLGLYGWWKLTTPDPSYTGRDTGDGARGILRSVVAALAIFAIISAPFNIIVVAQPGILGQGLSASLLVVALLSVASFFLYLVQFFASLHYIAWLGRRVPDPEIVARAYRYRWLLPMIFFLGLLVLVGPFIAFIMYYMLLNRLRRRLKVLDEPFAKGELGSHPAPAPTAPA